MKTIGALKPLIPTNAFVKIIYTDDSAYYFSKVSNGNIESFYSIEIEKKQIEFFKKFTVVKKGSEEYLCFIDNKNNLYHGFKSEIENDLISLLDDNKNLNLYAKCEIAGELGFNGLINKYLDTISEQNKSFTPDLDYFLDRKLNNLNNNEDLYKKMIELDKKASKFNLPLDNLIATKDTSFYFGNNKVEIDYFLNQTLSKKLPNSIQSEYEFYCDYDNSLYNILKKNSFIHCIKNPSLYKIAVRKDTDLANKKLNNHLFKWRHLYSSIDNRQSSISDDEKSYIIEDVNIENQILDIYYTKGFDIEKKNDKKVLLEVDTNNLEKDDGEKKLLEMGDIIIQNRD